VIYIVLVTMATKTTTTLSTRKPPLKINEKRSTTTTNVNDETFGKATSIHARRQHNQRRNGLFNAHCGGGHWWRRRGRR
jgi:hypothetical protein